MNHKQAIAAALLVFTGSAVFAQAELQHFGAPQQAASTTTREAVRAEVLRARAAGEALVPSEADVAGLFPKVTPGAVVRTRAEVRAEAIAATRAAQTARVQAGH